MKNKILFLFILCVVTLFSKSSFADRKGFLLSFAPRAGYETQSLKRAYGGAALRAGWGFNDRFALYYEGQIDMTGKNGLTYYAFDSQAKGQLYLIKDLYVNGEVGVSVGRVALLHIVLDGKTGFVASTGIVYEFKVYDRFFIAPEGNYIYRKIKGNHYN